jgi:hypothetical protein
MSTGPRILPVYPFVLGQELDEAIGQAIGAASVCWDPMDGTGVFQESRARQIGDELKGIILKFARSYPDEHRLPKAPVTLREGIASILNSHSHENVSNTPDFILASFLTACLDAFDGCVVAREDWYGHRHEPGGVVHNTQVPSEQAENRPRCDHHFVSKHEPDHEIYWVKICSLCGEPDWYDLDRQIREASRARDTAMIADIRSEVPRDSEEPIGEFQNRIAQAREGSDMIAPDDRWRVVLPPAVTDDALKLHIWVAKDNPVPEGESLILTNIELRFKATPEKLQVLALNLAGEAVAAEGFESADVSTED